jgi:hypothetical protein
MANKIYYVLWMQYRIIKPIDLSTQLCTSATYHFLRKEHLKFTVSDFEMYSALFATFIILCNLYFYLYIWVFFFFVVLEIELMALKGSTLPLEPRLLYFLLSVCFSNRVLC